MPDARTFRTDKALKDALLALLSKKQLSQISVSDLCRTANVSRSTFYGHFNNIQEVFERLISDFMKEIRTLGFQLKCKSCSKTHPADKMPYCIAVRTTKRYAALVKDPQYLPALLRAGSAKLLAEDVLAPYLDLGVKPEIARNLFEFQMAGCHIVATNSDASIPWEERQRALDAFIAGGMNAVRSLAQAKPKADD